MRKTLPGLLAFIGCLVGGVAFADGDNVRTYQTVNLFQAGAPSVILQGAATLFRSRNGADLRIAATHLDTNAAYTVWWVVFNEPQGCVGPCGPTNLGNPAARASVFYAAGFVTGDDGVGNVTAHLDDGPLPIGVEVTPDGTVRGLERGNGFAAEIHVVVRTHGAVIVGHAFEQIASFNGACPPNTCMNQQAAMFPPVAHHHKHD